MTVSRETMPFARKREPAYHIPRLKAIRNIDLYRISGLLNYVKTCLMSIITDFVFYYRAGKGSLEFSGIAADIGAAA